jgi:hypothetical protein
LLRPTMVSTGIHHIQRGLIIHMSRISVELLSSVKN